MYKFPGTSLLRCHPKYSQRLGFEEPSKNGQGLPSDSEFVHCNNVLLKGMSRKKCSPSAQCRSFFLGIQPTRLNVHSYFREWSSSAPRSYFVPACEAEKRCSSVVPFLLP